MIVFPALEWDGSSAMTHYLTPLGLLLLALPAGCGGSPHGGPSAAAPGAAVSPGQSEGTWTTAFWPGTDERFGDHRRAEWLWEGEARQPLELSLLAGDKVLVRKTLPAPLKRVRVRLLVEAPGPKTAGRGWQVLAVLDWERPPAQPGESAQPPSGEQPLGPFPLPFPAGDRDWLPLPLPDQGILEREDGPALDWKILAGFPNLRIQAGFPPSGGG